MKGELTHEMLQKLFETAGKEGEAGGAAADAEAKNYKEVGFGAAMRIEVTAPDVEAVGLEVERLLGFTRATYVEDGNEPEHQRAYVMDTQSLMFTEERAISGDSAGVSSCGLTYWSEALEERLLTVAQAPGAQRIELLGADMKPLQEDDSSNIRVVAQAILLDRRKAIVEARAKRRAARAAATAAAAGETASASAPAAAAASSESAPGDPVTAASSSTESGSSESTAASAPAAATGTTEPSAPSSSSSSSSAAPVLAPMPPFPVLGAIRFRDPSGMVITVRRAASTNWGSLTDPLPGYDVDDAVNRAADKDQEAVAEAAEEAMAAVRAKALKGKGKGKDKKGAATGGAGAGAGAEAEPDAEESSTAASSTNGSTSGGGSGRGEFVAPRAPLSGPGVRWAGLLVPLKPSVDIVSMLEFYKRCGFDMFTRDAWPYEGGMATDAHVVLSFLHTTARSCPPGLDQPAFMFQADDVEAVVRVLKGKSKPKGVLSGAVTKITAHPTKDGEAVLYHFKLCSGQSVVLAGTRQVNVLHLVVKMLFWTALLFTLAMAAYAWYNPTAASLMKALWKYSISGGTDKSALRMLM